MIDLAKFGQILYISSVDISVGNGPGVNEREFILALYKAVGDRAHFVIPQPINPVPEVPAGVCTFSSPHQGHSTKLLFRHIVSTIQLAGKLLSRRQFDLIIFRLDILPIAPFYIKRKYSTPYVLKTLGQGMMKAFDGRLGPLGPLLAKTNRFLVKKVVNDALVVDSVSELMIEYLQEELDITRDKLLLADNAVNTDRFFPTSKETARRALGLEHRDPIIGYVGNLPDVQGGSQLVQAAPKLLEKYPNLGVVVLGDGEGRKNLIDLANRTGVSDHCVFTGYVPFEQVPTYINALDIGVSFRRSQTRAASELKVRQYLACGKPVIATTPGSNDFLASARLGSLVDYDDLQFITQEIDRWLSLPEDEREAASSRTMQYARDHLSVDQAVARRIAVWNERLDLRESMGPAEKRSGLSHSQAGS